MNQMTLFHPVAYKVIVIKRVKVHSQCPKGLGLEVPHDTFSHISLIISQLPYPNLTQVRFGTVGPPRGHEVRLTSSLSPKTF